MTARFSPAPATASLGPGSERQSIHTIADAGTYRLRLGVARRAGDELEWVETSNAFTVR